MRTRTLSFALVAAVAAAACGPKPPAAITPTLPSDGTANVAQPPEPTKPAKAPDPWAGRTDLIQAPAAKAPQKLDLPPIERFTLPNGLQVIAVHDARLPVVSMQLAIKAGRGDEPLAHLGVSEFTADMLVKGTKRRKALDIAKAVDAVGAGLSVDSSFEATVASCKAMSRDLKVCLDLLPDVIENPTFPDDEMKRVREQIRAGIHRRYDDAGTLAALEVQNLLWGNDHVRGWVESDATLNALTRDDLVAWHKAWYAPNNAILAVAGDVDVKKLKGDLTRAFRGWRKAKVPPHPKYPVPKLSGVRIRLVDMPKQTQTQIRIAQFGIRHDDPRFFESLVWNYALGGGAFSSRLMKVVRSAAGKTYGASSTFDRNLEKGSFVATTYTRNKEAVATTKLVLGEIAKMAKDGPTAGEVADAIANIAGSYAVRFESAADVTGALLGAELHGFGEKYVENYALRIGKVDVTAAKDAAHDILDPANFVIVMVGDASEVEPQLQQAGWKYEKVKFTDPIGPRTEPTAPPPPDPKAQAAGQKLIATAIKAKGGEAKLRAIKTISMSGKGTVAGGGQKLDIVISRKFIVPDQTRVDVTIAGQINIAYAVSGKAGWQKSPQGVVDIPHDQLELLERQVWTDPEMILLRAEDKGAQVRALPDKELDGVTYALVNVTSPDGKLTATLFLDKKTHLIKQLAYPDQGGVSFDVFDDYRTVDGIKVAFKRSSKNEVESLDVTLDDYKVNPKVDAGEFARPK